MAKATEKTLFKHFPSKNDLVLAVIVDVVSVNVQGMQLSQYLLRENLRPGLIDFLSAKHNG